MLRLWQCNSTKHRVCAYTNWLTLFISAGQHRSAIGATVTCPYISSAASSVTPFHTITGMPMSLISYC